MIKTHIYAVIIGYILDMLLGDPYWLPHPIRLIGKLISALDKKLYSDDQKKAFRNGVLLVLMVVLITALAYTTIIIAANQFAPYYVVVCVESIMSYQILATKCLKVESMKVYAQLAAGNLEGARKAVSMIVGRDTESLDDIGITKAAVETVAENTSDGSIAPLIYLIIGGPILGACYKAINTMDSMIGYKNERYMYLGRAAAKLDDVVNFLPSRISAYLMMIACIFLGNSFDVKSAYRIHKRDARNHASPNSAQTESTCAGALNIRLAGNASYFGKIHEKPFIGDDVRPIEYEDIKRANKLLYLTSFLCLLIGCAIYYKPLLMVINWIFN